MLYRKELGSPGPIILGFVKQTRFLAVGKYRMASRKSNFCHSFSDNWAKIGPK